MNERFVRCSRCHTINPTDAASCRKCGFSLAPDAAEEPEQPAAVQKADTIDSVDIAPPKDMSDSFDGSIGAIATKDVADEWELGDIKPADEDDFSVGDVDIDKIERQQQEKTSGEQESKAQREKLGTWVYGQQAEKELKAQQTIKTHTDRREALVESLKTIQSVLRRRKEKRGTLNETVNAMGSDPMTIEGADPFSELLVKQTVNRDNLAAPSVNVPAPKAEPALNVQTPAVDHQPADALPQLAREPDRKTAPQPLNDTVEMESAPPAITASDSISRRYGVPVSPTETIESTLTSQSMVSMTTRGFGDEVDVAGFWIRAGAYALDLIILNIPIILMAYIGVMMAGHEYPVVWLMSYQGQGALITMMVMWLAWFLTYFTLFTWLGVSTPGKMLTGIKIIDWFGETPGLVKAFLRSLVYLLDTALFGLGFFWVIISTTHQAFHDKLVGTLVVRD